MKYQIYNLVGKNCMTPNDGQIVYNLIYSCLSKEQSVELDFTDVDIFASPFFNFAIGQLLRDIKPEKLNNLLIISNLNPLGKQVLKRVIENSKKYYSDPKYRQKVNDIISEQATIL